MASHLVKVGSNEPLLGSNIALIKGLERPPIVTSSDWSLITSKTVFQSARGL